MIRSIARPLTALVVILAIPSAAYAQSTKATVADKTADNLFKEGVQAGNAGDMEKARADFLAAYGIEKTPGTLWNLAGAEMKLGLNLDALQHFRRWLGTWTPKNKPLNMREQTLKYVEELKQKTGHLTFEGVSPDGLTIDGLETPLVDEGHPVEVEDVTPGHHVVVARYGSRTLHQDIEFAAGTTSSLHLEPEAPLPGTVAPPPSTVDGPRPANEATSALDRPADQTKSTHDSARTWVPIAIGVGGVVLVGVGAFLGVQSTNAANDGDRLHLSLPLSACPGSATCSTLHDDYVRGNNEHTASIVFYSVGAAAVVGGAVSYILLHRSNKETSVASPIIAPGTLGAQWITSF